MGRGRDDRLLRSWRCYQTGGRVSRPPAEVDRRTRRRAREELSLEQAQADAQREGGVERQRAGDSYVPHDLVPVRVARDILGVNADKTAILRLKRHGEPPALVVARMKLWRRVDGETVAAGRDVESRVENELGALYIDTTGLGRVLGITRTTSSAHRGCRSAT